MPKFDQDDQLLTNGTKVAGMPWRLIKKKVINDENEQIEGFEDERWYKNLKLGPVGKRRLEALIRAQQEQNHDNDFEMNSRLMKGNRIELFPLHDEDPESRVRHGV